MFAIQRYKALTGCDVLFIKLPKGLELQVTRNLTVAVSDGWSYHEVVYCSTPIQAVRTFKRLLKKYQWTVVAV